MIEKNSSKNDKNESNDNKSLPSSLPSPHSKYVTQRTTYGRVRIDLPAKTEQRQMIETLYKAYDPTSEQNRAFDDRIWSLVDEDVNKIEHDIDFYGLINAHYRNIKFEDALSSSTPKEEISDNYIDQLAFPELTTKKAENKSKKLEKEVIEDLKNEEMNPIDEQYFSQLKQIKYHDEKSEPIKRIEMPSKDDLNYIDQLVFSSQSEPVETKPIEKPIPNTSPSSSSSKPASDKLLDIDFQFRIANPERPKKSTVNDLNETPLESYNPKLESMRSIKPKDYFDPPRQSALDIQESQEVDSAKRATETAEHIREQLTKKTTVRDSFGYRTFDSLIPNWSTMTKAEIVDVLVKQICFIRRKKILIVINH